MGTALFLWRRTCFPFLLDLLFDSLKRLRSYFDGVLTSSESSASSKEETSSTEQEFTGKHQQIMEDDDELFEINLDAVGRKKDSSPTSSPVTIRFSCNNQVLLANRLSNATELSFAIPVVDQAPARAPLPPEVMARWVLGGGCDKARSSSFRELTSNLRQLLRIIAFPGRGAEVGDSSNRWGGDFGFRMEQLFSDSTSKTRWAAIS